MDTLDTLQTQDDLFSIEQLEERFELLAVPASGGEMLQTDWKCTLTLEV